MPQAASLGRSDIGVFAMRKFAIAFFFSAVVFASTSVVALADGGLCCYS